MADWKTDAALESKVREELYMGCVSAAEEWAEGIQDDDLRRDMNCLIREYEGSN